MQAYIEVFGWGSRDLELEAGFGTVRSCKLLRVQDNRAVGVYTAVLACPVAQFPALDLEIGFGVELALLSDLVLVEHSSLRFSKASSHSGWRILLRNQVVEEAEPCGCNPCSIFLGFSDS